MTEGRPRSRRRRHSIVLIALLACVLLLEIAPRVSTTCEAWVEPSDRLGSILRLFDRHPTRTWTLRRGLSTEFAGTSIEINDLALRGPAPGPAKASRRLLFLGESLCFGWGVAFEQAYSQLVAERLTASTGAAVEAINAGTPGYTTHQGLVQLRELGFDLQPDLVVAPFVVNDIDRLRFFRNDGSTDGELAPGSPAACSLHNLVSRSYGFLLYQRALLGTARALAGPRAEARALSSTLQCRVPADAYERNLRQYVDACRERDLPLLFVVQPLHLPVPRVAGQPADMQPLLDALADGRDNLSSRDAKRAMEHSRDRMKQTIDQALGGPDDQVQAAIDLSRQWDAYRCRAQAIRYNAIMRQIAAETSTPVADVSAAIAVRRAACDEGIEVCGGPLYRDAEDDPIHPNADGHRLYAHVISRILDERW